MSPAQTLGAMGDWVPVSLFPGLYADVLFSFGREPMMTSQAAIHKRNLESSILFMQQEHAGTLKALHEEIQKLQKKCSGEVVKAYHISSAIRWVFSLQNNSYYKLLNLSREILL